MRIRLASLVVAVAMISTLGGTSVFAHPVSDAKITVGETNTSSKAAPSAKDETKPGEKLKVDVLKLVADAKAGKVAPRQSQFPNTKRNNLSTGAKIGIAAAIGGVIFLIIVLHKLNSD